jgi:arylsulfatase A-like enzyme
MRIRPVAMLLIVAAGVVAAGTGLARAADAAPNFVLVMCDDLGWGDVGFNGNEVIRTPHLDAMAAAGMKFNRFYAASAVCSPTRGSVLTGRHPQRYGITGANKGHMLPGELTLAELLKQHGYTTGHFGKWHLGTLTTRMKDSNRGGPRGSEHFSPPWVNGFDVCFSTEAKVPTYDPMLQPPRRAAGRGWDFIADRSTAVAYGTHYWSWPRSDDESNDDESDREGTLVTDNLEGDDSRVIMDRVVPFVERAAREQTPFLAVVWFHTPHLPVVAGPEHAAMYAGYDSYERNYYGCITAMDEQIGRLRNTLREAGVADNTLLTFCSDNGPEGARGEAPGSAGPFRGRKRDLFEGGIRVPAVIEWPAKIAAGSMTEYPAVTSDYLPTILEILGRSLPDERPIDGVSLLRVFADPTVERSRPIGFEFDGKTALIDNRFKLVRYPAAPGPAAQDARQASTSAARQTRDMGARRWPDGRNASCLFYPDDVFQHVCNVPATAVGWTCDSGRCSRTSTR